MDDEKVIDERGQTLPLSNTVYDSLEIGISAAADEAVVYIDDIAVSDSGF